MLIYLPSELLGMVSDHCHYRSIMALSSTCQIMYTFSQTDVRSVCARESMPWVTPFKDKPITYIQMLVKCDMRYILMCLSILYNSIDKDISSAYVAMRPVFRTYNLGTKYSLERMAYLYLTQTDNAFKISSICRLIKREKLIDNIAKSNTLPDDILLVPDLYTKLVLSNKDELSNVLLNTLLPIDSAIAEQTMTNCLILGHVTTAKHISEMFDIGGYRINLLGMIDMIINVAKSGQLEALKYIRQTVNDDKWFFAHALNGANKLHIVEYLVELGAVLLPKHLGFAIVGYNIPLVNYIINKLHIVPTIPIKVINVPMLDILTYYQDIVKTIRYVYSVLPDVSFDVPCDITFQVITILSCIQDAKV